MTVDTSTISAQELFGWARTHAPDLRIGHVLGDDGMSPPTPVRTVHARFSYAGEFHELSATDDHTLARMVHARLMTVMGLAPDGGTQDDADRDALAKEVMLAALEGRADDKKALAKEYVLRTARARAATTRIRGRWNVT